MEASAASDVLSGDLPVRYAQPEQVEAAKPKPEPGVEEAPVDDDESVSNLDLLSTIPAKKKKSKKSGRPKSKRGIGAPTGFEEFYADAPVTPSEYEQLRQLYKPTRPFTDRIDEALMRYQKSRRLESPRMNVFSKYLQYGGVSVGPNPAGGVSAKELKEMDADEALRARSMTAICSERSKLEVNFDEVVRSYLSSYFPSYFLPENEDMIKLATVTIRNFLSYLLYHDVCPEYKENIEEARKTCDRATVELWKNQQLVQQGPGSFNKACSMLFGGYYFDIAQEEFEGMTHDIARKVVKFAIAGAGSNEQARLFKGLADDDALSARRVIDIDGFEITAVIEPDFTTRDFYQAYAPDLEPVGKIEAKAFHDPGKPALDLSPEERWEWDHGMAPTPTFEFFIEATLLRHCYLGMKILTAVWELNCGLHFFDEIMSAYTSFYTVIGNDLMLEFKRPKDLTATEAEQDEYDDVVETVGLAEQQGKKVLETEE